MVLLCTSGIFPETRQGKSPFLSPIKELLKVTRTQDLENRLKKFPPADSVFGLPNPISRVWYMLPAWKFHHLYLDKFRLDPILWKIRLGGQESFAITRKGWISGNSRNRPHGGPTLEPFCPGENLSKIPEIARGVTIWPKLFRGDWGSIPRKFSLALIPEGPEISKNPGKNTNKT